jgi:hypothetical protein
MHFWLPGPNIRSGLRMNMRNAWKHYPHSGVAQVLESRASAGVRIPFVSSSSDACIYFFPANVVFAKIMHVYIIHTHRYRHFHRIVSGGNVLENEFPAVRKLMPKIFENIPSTNNTMKISYGKMPFNDPFLRKMFLNFRNVATSGLVTVHKYGLSAPRI